MLAVNDELCEIFGHSKAEMFQPGMFDRLSDPDDHAREKAMLCELIAGEREHYKLPKRYVKSDGTSLPSIVDAKLARDENGLPDTVFGVVVVPALTGVVCEYEESAEYDEMRRLLAWRSFLELELASVNADLALAALRVTERGRTRRDLARELGVGVATVQGWIDRARRLR